MLFSPGLALSRAMVVTILYRLEGEPDVSDLDNPFDDVAAGLWYTDAVKWAADAGIVQGYGGGRFGPTDNITRQDLAVILMRYADHNDLEPTAIRDYEGFNDDDAIAAYAKDAVTLCFEIGVINGRDGNVFDPRGNATRAEAAAMLQRFIQAIG